MIKRELTTDPGALLLIDIAHQDLVTLDIVLTQCSEPTSDGVIIPEPFLSDFERVLTSWAPEIGAIPG